ncbi:MAG TPA: hypothetical protein PK854_08755 [Oscillospiraceae bacterium]|nr:hypothetical protein [Oscillospiraceae bacterium]HPS35342.1 hypothetical protein [Oscillospiraceae bacterium]
MKKSVKLIAAVLMAAVLAFSLCIGLAAKDGGINDIYSVATGGCGYAMLNGICFWDAEMNVSQANTDFDFHWSLVYTAATNTNYATQLASNGQLSYEPGDSADLSYYSASGYTNWGEITLI